MPFNPICNVQKEMLTFEVEHLLSHMEDVFKQSIKNNTSHYFLVRYILKIRQSSRDFNVQRQVQPGYHLDRCRVVNTN